jgi:hypothetical protein
MNDEFSDYGRTGPNVMLLIATLSALIVGAGLVARGWWALSRVPVVVTW